ncbi:hypothetical protein EON63_08390 [archaeon]|nr:MAG: hypothetical protein EON63_08390 [archaeon]
MLFGNNRFLEAYQYLSTVWYTLESRSLDFSNLPDEQDLCTLYPLCVLNLSNSATICKLTQSDTLQAFLHGITSLQSQFSCCYEVFAASAMNSHYSPPDVEKNAVYVLQHRLHQFNSCQTFAQLVYLCRVVFDSTGYVSTSSSSETLSSLYSRYSSSSPDPICTVISTDTSASHSMPLKSCTYIILLFAAHRVQHDALCDSIAEELINLHGQDDDGVQNLLSLLDNVKAEFRLPVSSADVVSVVTKIETMASENLKQMKQGDNAAEQQLDKNGEEADDGDNIMADSYDESVAVALEFTTDEIDNNSGMIAHDEIDLMVEDDTVQAELHDDRTSPVTPKDNLSETVVESINSEHQQALEEVSLAVASTPPSSVLDRSRTEREVAETLVSRFVSDNSVSGDEPFPIEGALHDLNMSIQEYLQTTNAENIKPSEGVGKLIAALLGAQQLSFLLSQELDKVIQSANK